MQNLKLTEVAPGRYSAAIGNEIIVHSGKHPTAAACQQLLDSGRASTKDLVRVTGGDPSSFVVSLDRFSRYKPSGARIAFERAPFRARHDA
jgi:hypothetical protein